MQEFSVKIQYMANICSVSACSPIQSSPVKQTQRPLRNRREKVGGPEYGKGEPCLPSSLVLYLLVQGGYYADPMNPRQQGEAPSKSLTP